MFFIRSMVLICSRVERLTFYSTQLDASLNKTLIFQLMKIFALLNSQAFIIIIIICIGLLFYSVGPTILIHNIFKL